MTKDTLPDIGIVAVEEINGLSIRYAQSGPLSGFPIILTAPWPESIYSFHLLAPVLSKKHRVILVDLPGFGLSQSRPGVMSPEAMGNFLIDIIKHFKIDRTHIVAPDVGTLAALFAASKHEHYFESLVIGGAAMQPDLAAGALKDLIHSPAGSLLNVGSDGVRSYLEQASILTPATIIEDFRSASSGVRLEEAAQFVRGYIHDLPKLEPRLNKIHTPTLIIAGKNDPIVPPINAEFLSKRLPNCKNILLDAEHRVWEEAADDYNKAIDSWFSGEYSTKHSS